MPDKKHRLKPREIPRDAITSSGAADVKRPVHTNENHIKEVRHSVDPKFVPASHETQTHDVSAEMKQAKGYGIKPTTLDQVRAKVTGHGENCLAIKPKKKG